MKLNVAMGLFTALIFAVITFLSVELYMVTDLLKTEAATLAVSGESVSTAKDVRTALLVYNRDKYISALMGTSSSFDQISRRAKIMSLVEKSKHLMNNQNEKSILSDLDRELEKFFQQDKQLDALSLSLVEKYRQRIEIGHRVTGVVENLVEAEVSQSQSILESIQSQNMAADLKAISVLSFATVSLLSGFLAMFLFLTKPLNLIAKTIMEYRNGKYPARARARSLKEIRLIEENFCSMADVLEENRKNQLQFLASIAHDLRNPLGSISMASELLIMNGKEVDRELNKIIFRQTKNLERLVGDLLDTTRIEAGELSLEPSVADVAPLVKDTVELHRNGSALHDIQVVVPTDSLLSSCDRGRITQVLNNLISNAVKYSPNGGTVTVKAWREKDQIGISVEDQGMGVDPQDIDNIFKPFHRSKATKGTIPGIGLGLSASRRIIEAHSGKLSVTSTLGRGSTFLFTLPGQANTQHTSQAEEKQKKPPLPTVEL